MLIHATSRLVDIVNVAAYDLGSSTTNRNAVVHHSPTLLGPLGVKQRFNLVRVQTLKAVMNEMCFKNNMWFDFSSKN